MNRQNFSQSVETEILILCRRRCALCFGLSDDAAEKDGQIAHIDRNSANNEKENAAFLCLAHHNKYDSKPSQSKQIKPEELREYQKRLYEYLAMSGRLSVQQLRVRKQHPTQTKTAVTIDVYERRIPVYQMTVRFLQAVLQDLRPDLQEILTFGRETDEAIFLFDDAVSDYLSELVKKALRLRAVSLTLNKEWTQQLAEEETALAAWFGAQFDETRKKFAPFLRLAS